ncbi:MAG TPA: hypothetical protein PKA13_19350 [Geminicoccaceae bacterium]|nr:hypothetical protein [Geminicoccus sp.]HMU51941.1 hypothetical protein [Geminicoccaceae bacterium]
MACGFVAPWIRRITPRAAPLGTLAGAVLAFFGFMHGEAIGVAVTPSVTLAYLAVAAFLFGCARYQADEPILDEEPAHGHHAAAPAE